MIAAGGRFTTLLPSDAEKPTHQYQINRPTIAQRYYGRLRYALP